MTPAARLATAIELLAAIGSSEQPADGVLRAAYRKQRFIGSKDRRAISNHVYGVIRHLARLDWWLARGGLPAGGARTRVLAAQVLLNGQTAANLDVLCDGAGYHPAPLEPEERQRLESIEGCTVDHAEQPHAVRCELPAWLYPDFAAAFGESLDSEMAALSQESPVDLRVNTLKATVEQASAALAGEGIEARPTPWAPNGLRLSGRLNLPATQVYRDGWIEVQDEGSQIVALLADVEPGMTFADLCAGAGGKTLALAAALEGQGTLIALDRDKRRLSRAQPRLARAGADFVELRPLEGPDDPWLGSEAGRFDRVLVDAPCTGSGAWRRHPDARWLLTSEALDGYRAAQREVLAMAAGLVKPGGRLIYATCSLLPSENQEAIAAFLSEQTAFEAVAPGPVAARHLKQDLAVSEDSLQLTPARHGTDGFFLAILQRRPEP